VNLAGALVDAGGSHVAEEALDTPILGVAPATEDLDHPMGNAEAHFRGEVFAQGHVHGDVLPPVELPGRFENERPSAFDVHLALRQHGLNQLIVADGPTPLLPLPGVTNPFVQQANGWGP